MRRAATVLAAACLLAALLASGAAAASQTCLTMRHLLHRGGGSQSGLIVIDAKTGHVVCGSAARRQRPLASNMKLFTTGTVLAKLGPRKRIATKVFADGRLTADGVLHGSLYLRGGGDPTLGAPAFYDNYLSGVGTNLYALKAKIKAAGIKRITGRLYADDSFFDRLRGVADSGYATSGEIGPLSALEFNAGHAGGSIFSGFSSDPAKLAASKLARSLSRAGVEVPRRVALGVTPPSARPDRGRPLPHPEPDRQLHRRLLLQLLRRDADQAARRRTRQGRHHRRRRRRGHLLRPLARHQPARGRRLRPDPLGPRLALAAGPLPLRRCASRTSARSSSTTSPSPASRAPSTAAWAAPPPTAAATSRPAP